MNRLQIAVLLVTLSAGTSAQKQTLESSTHAQQRTKVTVRALSCKDGHPIKNRKAELYDSDKGVLTLRTGKDGSAVFLVEGEISWVNVLDSDVAYSNIGHVVTKDSLAKGVVNDYCHNRTHVTLSASPSEVTFYFWPMNAWQRFWSPFGP